MNKAIAVFVSIMTIIAMLLLGIALLLLYAPGVLLNYLHIGVIVACIIAGAYMLIPLFIVIAITAINKMRRKHK